jgi:hypothetical protein
MDLPYMGGAGRQWMQREFSWDAIAKRMIEVYCAKSPASAAHRSTGKAARGASAASLGLEANP